MAAGALIPGQDAADEENADKQLNFGFTFGDEGIPEPYFYVAAWPNHQAFAALALPAPSRWHDSSFSGAALRYRELIAHNDATGRLQALWRTMLDTGREYLADSQRGDHA